LLVELFHIRREILSKTSHQLVGETKHFLIAPVCWLTPESVVEENLSGSKLKRRKASDITWQQAGKVCSNRAPKGLFLVLNTSIVVRLVAANNRCLEIPLRLPLRANLLVFQVEFHRVEVTHHE